MLSRWICAKLRTCVWANSMSDVDVGHVDHHPIVDDLVVLIQPVPVGNPHLDLATGRRKAEPLTARVRCGERRIAAGDRELAIAKAV
jgi:hypothetical protein